MDSLSGSLRDSEPTSPNSPGSPEPSDNPSSPIALSQALHSLQQKGNSTFLILSTENEEYKFWTVVFQISPGTIS